MKTRCLMTVLVIFAAAICSADAQSLRKIQNDISKKFNDSIQAIKDYQAAHKYDPGFQLRGIFHPSNTQSQNNNVNDAIQSLNDQKTLAIRNAELDYLLKQADDNLLITPSDYNTLIRTKFRTLSGTEIKNGKYMGSSITVDTKSATVNISLKPFKNTELYLLPTIAGSSSNGFVTVVTGDKYSRTITGGLNFIILGRNNKSRFKSPVRNQVHNDLKILRRTYAAQPNADVTYFKSRIKDLQTVLTASGSFIRSYYTSKIDLNAAANNYSDLETYKKALDTLTKVKLLPAKFNQKTVSDQLDYLSSIEQETIANLALNNYLDKADKIQLKADFSENTLGWLGGGVKYNQANYNVADGSLPALQRGVMDEYISVNLSYTWMWLWESGNHIYFSPTFNYQNSHNFNSSNQIHAEILQNYPIGLTVTQRVTKDLTLYPNVPDRLATNFIDLPVAYYNVKWGVGFQVDYKYGYNDANNDNRDASIGVLIPVNQSGSNVLVIEPLAKAQKLNLPVTNFWQNNFVLGINVSVSIPKSFFN